MIFCSSFRSRQNARQDRPLIQKGKKDRLLTGFCIKHSPVRPPLAANVCTAVIALETWRPCSVSALQGRTESVKAKTKARLSSIQLCTFASRTPALCCSEAVSAFIAYFRNTSIFLEYIPNSYHLLSLFEESPQTKLADCGWDFCGRAEKNGTAWCLRKRKSVMRKNKEKKI